MHTLLTLVTLVTMVTWSIVTFVTLAWSDINLGNDAYFINPSDLGHHGNTDLHLHPAASPSSPRPVLPWQPAQCLLPTAAHTCRWVKKLALNLVYRMPKNIKHVWMLLQKTQTNNPLCMELAKKQEGPASPGSLTWEHLVLRNKVI